MYCWSCGRQTSENLNYCSGCGARIDKTLPEDEQSWTDNPATAVGYLGVFGLVGFIFFVIQLLKRNLELGFVFAISLLYLAALFGICFLIIRQMSPRTEEDKPKKRPREEEIGDPQKFRTVVTNQLNAPHEPAVSVTENTTKTLDEVLIERKN